MSGPVRIMILKNEWEIEKQNACNADANRSESNLKTSYGRSYGHQHHVLLTNVCFIYFVLFLINYTELYSLQYGFATE